MPYPLETHYLKLYYELYKSGPYDSLKNKRKQIDSEGFCLWNLTHILFEGKSCNTKKIYTSFNDRDHEFGNINIVTPKNVHDKTLSLQSFCLTLIQER